MSQPWYQMLSVRRRGFNAPNRRGTVLVLAAFLMIVMFSMLAFSIDLGYILTVQTELQRSVDSAALASVGVLSLGNEFAEEKAVEYLVRNPAGNRYQVNEASIPQLIANFKSTYLDDYEINIGHWDPTAFDENTGLLGKVVAADGPPSAVEVFHAINDEPLFFGGLLGKEHFSVQARSVAQYQPRDIVLVLDLSGSMNDDTEFKSINTLGREHVEGNLLQCWNDLGAPAFGSLPFYPEYASVPGMSPPNEDWPQLHVEYRRDKVQVSSTLSLSKVRLEFTNGSTQNFYNIGSNSGMFAGTGSNYGRAIDKVWVRSGDNAWLTGSGNGEEFDFSSNYKIRNMVKKAFGLDQVAYPYPGGSWDEYIDYCRDSSNNSNANAGYYYQFGGMSLMNYWLEIRNSSNDMPDLWQCSAYPITAVKNSVSVFMGYIQEVDTADRVGLSVYNWSDGDGKLEFPLTEDLQNIETVTETFQAGHYHNYTNIGAGMTKAREELINNARPGAFKLMVLMTDGVANWVNGGTNSSGARQYVLNEAYLAKGSKLPILTISLGAGADTSLMQEVADITGGQHFNVPGGGTVQQYHAELLQVFREIADDRPMKIVQ